MWPMRFYASGGMTGWENNNEEEFDLVKDALERLGHHVDTPVEFGREEGEDLSGDGFSASDEEYEGYLARDLERISKNRYDAVVFVRGWKQSGGAGREGRKAIEEGLQLYTWDRRYPSTLMVLTPEAFIYNSRTERLRREELEELHPTMPSGGFTAGACEALDGTR